MDKQKMRAYFKAYRARINDLEREVDDLGYTLDCRYEAESRMSRRLSNLDSQLRDVEQKTQFDRWDMEDRIKKIERSSRW